MTTTAPARKFRKGDAIVQIGFYNEARTQIWVRRLTVQSWGKKQGTASDATGRLIEDRLYADRTDRLAMADDADAIEATILRLIADEQARVIRWIEHASRAGSGYEGPFWARKIAEEKLFTLRTRGEFEVRDYDELRAETRARIAAERAG